MNAKQHGPLPMANLKGINFKFAFCLLPFAMLFVFSGCMLATQKDMIQLDDNLTQMRKNQADMERFRDDLMAKSRREAELLRAEAERAIQEERSKAIAEIKGLTVDLAIDIAAKLIGEQLDGPKQRKLAEQFIEQLPKKSEGPARPVV